MSRFFPAAQPCRSASPAPAAAAARAGGRRQPHPHLRAAGARSASWRRACLRRAARNRTGNHGGPAGDPRLRRRPSGPRPERADPVRAFLAKLRPLRRTLWPWTPPARPRSRATDPGACAKRQRRAVGAGRRLALAGAGRCRRHDRQSRFQDRAKVAPRGGRIAATVLAAAADRRLRSKRCAHALADRRGNCLTRSLRSRFRLALAGAARALPQRTAG